MLWDESAVGAFKALAARRGAYRNLRPEKLSQTPANVYQRAWRARERQRTPEERRKRLEERMKKMKSRMRALRGTDGA